LSITPQHHQTADLADATTQVPVAGAGEKQIAQILPPRCRSGTPQLGLRSTVDRVFALIGLICDEDFEMNKPVKSQEAIDWVVKAMAAKPAYFGNVWDAYKVVMDKNPKIDP
jgi:hypothetical protein